MTLWEALLVVFALSVNVFLVAEYEGSNLRKLNVSGLVIVCLIFFAGQMISMGGGYLLTMLPVFQVSLSPEVTKICCLFAAVIFFFIGAIMLYRCRKKENLEERLRELRYSRLIVEAATVALFTFAAGIGCGLLHANLISTFITVACATVLAVIAGLYTGYSQGARFRHVGFGMSGAAFVAMGIEVVVRYL